MPILQAILYGIIQGLTEFLPISSTAHLALTPWLVTELHLAAWTDPGLTFDVALHAGTLLAVVLYFAGTWVRILRAAFAGQEVEIGRAAGASERVLSSQHPSQPRLLFWFLVAATIPAGIAGVLLEKKVETSFRAPLVMALSMIVVALLMWWAEKAGSFQKPLERTSLGDSLVIGVAQATALVPGVSRSGATITAGLFCGMTRDAAAQFSFLLSTPIIAGAALLKGHEVWKQGIPAGMRVPFLAGMLVSAVVGYAAIAWFIRYLRTRTLKIFIVYRLVFGIIILALAYFAHFQQG